MENGLNLAWHEPKPLDVNLTAAWIFSLIDWIEKVITDLYCHHAFAESLQPLF